MSKLAVAGTITGVGGTGAAGTYAAYHFGVFGGGGSTGSEPSTNFNLPNTVDEFKNSNGGYCINDIFNQPRQKNDQLLKNASTVGTTQANETKLGSADSGNSVSSCLLVHWNKSQNSGQQWTGSFRLSWAVSRGNAGFSVYLAGNTENDNSMKFDGVSYVFEKTTDNKWELKSKLDIKDGSKTLTKDQLKTLLPQKGKGFQDDPENYDNPTSDDYSKYWDFLDKDGSQIKETSYHEWNPARMWSSYVSSPRKTADMKEWSSNLEAWWKHFFDDGTKWNMVDVVKEIKGGWQ